MTYSTIKETYHLPLTTLILRAQEVHHKYHDPSGVKLNALLSIKTGRCSEDCKYCSQSAHHKTFVQPQKLMSPEEVEHIAVETKATGASRMCLGAAWSTPPNEANMQSVLDSVRTVKQCGIGVCCSLGALSKDQACALKEAGCDIYSHNIDTSREYYPKIISTRTFEDRLRTIANAKAAGLKICCGGILGMGESEEDRLRMVEELVNIQPSTVPINTLVRVPGTPLAEQSPVDPIDVVRLLATLRIMLPKAWLTFSGGRTQMSETGQALCFLAGVNSIHIGAKLLTTDNGNVEKDRTLLHKLGLHPLRGDN